MLTNQHKIFLVPPIFLANLFCLSFTTGFLQKVVACITFLLLKSYPVKNELHCVSDSEVFFSESNYHRVVARDLTLFQ